MIMDEKRLKTYHDIVTLIAVVMYLFATLASTVFAVSLPASATVAVKKGNLRKKPSMQSAVIDKLNNGETVTILGQHKKWYYIKLANGRRGWAHKTFFNEIEHTAIKKPSKTDTFLKQITAIQMVIFSPDEERVVVTLNGYFPPETSTIEGKQPRIFCDFLDIHPQGSIAKYIEGKGQYIRKIGIQYSGLKTRVIVELSSKHDYDIQQVFIEEYNQYALIIRKM